GELVLPGGHGGAGDAVGDPVEELGIGVAGGHVDAQVGRGRAQGGGGPTVAAGGVALGDGRICGREPPCGGEPSGGGRGGDGEVAGGQGGGLGDGAATDVQPDGDH